MPGLHTALSLMLTWSIAQQTEVLVSPPQNLSFFSWNCSPCMPVCWGVHSLSLWNSSLFFKVTAVLKQMLAKYHTPHQAMYLGEGPTSNSVQFTPNSAFRNHSFQAQGTIQDAAEWIRVGFLPGRWPIHCAIVLAHTFCCWSVHHVRRFFIFRTL